MKILIVDDEEMQCRLLGGFLEKQGYTVSIALSGAEALQRFSEHPFQLVLLDHRMPDMPGDEVLRRMKAVNPLVRSMMITAYGSVDTAVTVMKLGADDFLEKPVDLREVLEKIRRIEQSVMIEEEAAGVAEEADRAALPMNIIGESAAMKEVLSLVRRIAPTDWTALIRGETGTGKELIARLIHLLSPRREQPFIEVNCAAIPENLFESELFGHEKGAFTGASSSRKGRFELAKNGSLFLDEVGELPLSLQAKLLRALQEKKISRIGSEKEIPVDVRVLAATNRDLKKRVAEGAFREDLFYRLNVLDLEIPPLRRRKSDIPALVTFFTERYSPRPLPFDADAMTTLVKYAFPGNVRELEHMIQRITTLTRGSVIRAGDLPPEIRFQQATEQGSLAERLEILEREMLLSALEKHGWVQTRAAESLGISERVLRYKMKKQRISKP
ncbi:sigma-54-dependent Fis family transcriptional re gulator [Desulfonema ishimotonii]|uniref:Sigma-54-dependent Fis family transcriptional re gulator n=1 Tax=Desulfonema ishimotonii TaxID=45657 RepID=A0A401FWP3_9BACT|nr:sigma-54 dependent transcriptional regulator [Desulfonema ishimotonii]GBC61359.1 sigma-54-dependent Fis family transcriptional re gulator [Desulfonema ishimotonii]